MLRRMYESRGQPRVEHAVSRGVREVSAPDVPSPRMRDGRDACDL